MNEKLAAEEGLRMIEWNILDVTHIASGTDENGESTIGVREIRGPVTIPQ
jgi:hypothetical protein